MEKYHFLHFVLREITAEVSMFFLGIPKVMPEVSVYSLMAKCRVLLLIIGQSIIIPNLLLPNIVLQFESLLCPKNPVCIGLHTAMK